MLMFWKMHPVIDKKDGMQGFEDQLGYSSIWE
jgi:hypothetical protein